MDAKLISIALLLTFVGIEQTSAQVQKYLQDKGRWALVQNGQETMIGCDSIYLSGSDLIKVKKNGKWPLLYPFTRFLSNFIYNEVIDIRPNQCESFSLDTIPQKKKSNIIQNVKLKVNGKVETHTIFCGGAYRKGMLVRNIPIPNYKLYVKKGTSNDLKAPIIDSVMTNQYGNFSLDLLSGEYILISEIQKNKDLINSYLDLKNPAINKQCLEDWWKNGLIKIKVEEEPLEDIHIFIQKRCFQPPIPCKLYFGPYPP